MVKAMMGEDLSLSKIVLLKKYLNFSDVFDEAQINILLQHSQQNLTIKLESDK